jgi:hypothetical protein
VTLNGLERITEQFQEYSEKLEAINPQATKEIIEDKLKQLPGDLRRAFLIDKSKRTPAEEVKAQSAESKIKPTVDELAARAPLDRQLEARKIAKEMISLADRERLTRTNRQVINFEFWRDRCQSGSTENSVKARKYLYEADQLLAKPDLKGAHKKYEQSFRAWAEVFKTWPILMDDADTGDIIEAVEKYITVRDQLDLRDTSGGVLPPSFPLKALLEKKGEDAKHLMRFRKEEDEVPAEEKPAASTPAPAAEIKKTEPESSPPAAESTKPAETKAEESAESSPAAPAAEKQ